jgi:hypothetical protein
MISGRVVEEGLVGFSEPPPDASGVPPKPPTKPLPFDYLVLAVGQSQAVLVCAFCARGVGLYVSVCICVWRACR